MTRPLAAVVMASFQRAHLLARSLECYERHSFPNDRLELVVIDDHSTDGTRDLVLDWSKRTGIRATVLTVAPKPAEWADCGWCLNAGIRATSAEYVLLTHPEVMPGYQSVAACVGALAEWESKVRWNPLTTGHHLGLYACSKVYYLSRRDQDRIDTVDWRTRGALAVRDIEGFYEEQPSHPDYSHAATDAIGIDPEFRFSLWESWVWSGMSRETWKRFGGMRRTEKWGSCDVDWLHRRRVLGIRNHTCLDPETIVVHQNHDGPGDVPTPRIEGEWKEELASMPSDPHQLRYPAVDELGW